MTKTFKRIWKRMLNKKGKTIYLNWIEVSTNGHIHVSLLHETGSTTKNGGSGQAVSFEIKQAKILYELLSKALEHNSKKELKSPSNK